MTHISNEKVERVARTDGNSGNYRNDIDESFILGSVSGGQNSKCSVKIQWVFNSK